MLFRKLPLHSDGTRQTITIQNTGSDPTRMCNGCVFNMENILLMKFLL